MASTELMQRFHSDFANLHRMLRTPQEYQDISTQFLYHIKLSQEEPSSPNITRCIVTGQQLLEILPPQVPLYAFSSWRLARCLMVTWQETNAEQKRDYELLDIICMRFAAAVKHCSPNDPFRGQYFQDQKTWHVTVMNFSARLEDDFHDHERISKLNMGVTYANAAWQMLSTDPVHSLNAADNYGNLLCSRYLYLGRPQDLDGALDLSARQILKSQNLPRQRVWSAYHSYAVRLSQWSAYEDQPDENPDAVQYVDDLLEGRQWRIENVGVTESSGSSYAIALEFASQIRIRAFLRRRPRTSVRHNLEHLFAAIKYATYAINGILPIDPGRLLCLNNFSRTSLALYRHTALNAALSLACVTICGALKQASQLTSPREPQGVRFSGTGASIQSLAATSELPSHGNSSSIVQIRRQRWTIETVEIFADSMLARYSCSKGIADLEIAISALKLVLQGRHIWHPRRSVLLFKLNAALREQLRVMDNPSQLRFKNLVTRLEGGDPRHLRTHYLRLPFTFFNEITGLGAVSHFVPLSRPCEIACYDAPYPTTYNSDLVVVPRGLYETDMKLSVEMPNIAIADSIWSTGHLTMLLTSMDRKLDQLLQQLNQEEPETRDIMCMWKVLFHKAGPSLKRAELYQKTLTAFLRKQNFEIALKIANMSEVVLGNLEMHLFDPREEVDLSIASQLAITLAALRLKTDDTNLWKTLLSVERGREIGSRHGANAVKGHRLESSRELLAHVNAFIHHLSDSRSEHDNVNSSRDTYLTGSMRYMQTWADWSWSKIFLKPFGEEQCLFVAGRGYVVELVPSLLGIYAIILSRNGLRKLELQDCTIAKLGSQVEQFRAFIKACEEDPFRIGEANLKLRKLLKWLWTAVVRPILRLIGLRRCGTGSLGLPRLKWVTTGIFSQLPVHAAGIYTDGPGRDFLDQYAVSSYISSIKSSLALQQKRSFTGYYQNSSRDFTMFGMSKSPQVEEGSLADLDVEDERRQIYACFDQSFCKNSIMDCNLGMARPMMTWARIIHFSCHGLSDQADPAKSRLVLLNDEKEPCTVAHIRDMEIPNPLLLFLSACHSALDQQSSQSDEISHVAKAFQIAGFPNVIGTLWQAYQQSSIAISVAFYQRLVAEWKPGLDDPPEDSIPRALHHAISTYRDNGGNWRPIEWASWVCFST